MKLYSTQMLLPVWAGSDGIQRRGLGPERCHYSPGAAQPGTHNIKGNEPVRHPIQMPDRFNRVCVHHRIRSGFTKNTSPDP